MKAKIEKTIVLELTEKQATMLCSLMQNPVSNVAPSEDDREFTEVVRKPLFETLKQILNYGVR